MAGFDPYDPLVQQALQAQGSQYVVPPAQPWGVPPLLAAVPPAPPQNDSIYQALEAGTGQPQPTPEADISNQLANAQGGRVFDVDRLAAASQSPLARLDAPPPPPQPQPTQPPVQRAPARRQSQSKQRMEQGLEGILGSFDDRREAAQKRAEIQEQTGRATADLMDRSSVDDLMAQQELADAHDTHMRATAKVQQEQREIANFVENYEPTDRRTNQQRVMGAIAVALAGYGDALSAEGGGSGGHMDRVLGIINTSIDRDMDQQRQLLDNKRTALAAKNSELGSMRQRYGDTVEATKLARAMKLDQYKRELEGIVAQGSSQEAATVAQDTIAQIDEQQGKILYEVYGQRYQQEMAAGRGMSAEKRLNLEGKALDNEKKRQELAGGTGPALPGYDATQKVAPADLSAARRIHSSAEGLKADYARLAAIRRKNAGGTIDRDDVAEARRILDSMPAKFSNLYGSGAPSGAEFDKFAETLLDPTSYEMPWGADPGESFARGADHIDRITQAQLSSYGFKQNAVVSAKKRGQAGAAR